METLKVIEEISKIIEIKIKKLKSLKALNKNIIGNDFNEYYDKEMNDINELRKLIDNFKDKLLE
jgi:TPP-dependent indolepyruvate ferredoxin oxidoreductase alpha subunit